jgi:hypothetical protein
MEVFAYRFVDIEVELVRKTIPIERYKELGASEIMNYFESFTFTGDSIVLRKGPDIGVIRGDGTIRVLTRDKSVDKTIDIFQHVLNLSKKFVTVDEINEIFNLDVDVIFIVEGKKRAAENLKKILSVQNISSSLGEETSALGLVIYLREFGKGKERDVIRINIEPWTGTNELDKYWIQIRWQRKDYKGIRFLSEMKELVKIGINSIKGIEGE